MDPIHIIAAVVLALALIGYIVCLVHFFWLFVIVSIGVVAYFTTVFPINSLTAIYWAGAFACISGGLAAALSYRRRHGRRRPGRGTKQSQGRIAIDGTNVLFWASEEAQLATLRRVVDDLTKRNFAPIVFLDASSRHHLKDKSLTEKGFAKALGLPQKQVIVCPAGTEADFFILQFASQESVPILSNDRFSDRLDLAKGINIVKGVFADNQLILDGI